MTTWLGPLYAGVAYGIAPVVVMASILSVLAFVESVGEPSAALFRDLTQVGIGLFLAFSVAIAGAGIRAGEAVADHVNWLGTGCGLGFCGLTAIGVSVALAAHREAGHANALDVVGLAWVAASLLLIGMAVAVLPYAAYSWQRPLE